MESTSFLSYSLGFKSKFFTLFFSIFVLRLFAAEPPTGLTTVLLEHTDRVILDG